MIFFAFSPRENEKKMIPNDITNRGCRTKVAAGLKKDADKEPHPPRVRSPNGIVLPSVLTASGRVLTTPLVAARILWTRYAGGSTGSNANARSHCCPACTSANIGPQIAQTRRCASKLSFRAGLNSPSSAPDSSVSNPVHSIPCFVSPGIRSPAYMYVVGGAQVPLVPG